MVFVGVPPARSIAESISARSISEVSVLPDQCNLFPAGLDAFKTSIARAKPVSVMRNARPISFSSSSVFASRSGQKTPFVVARSTSSLASARAKPSGKFAGTSALFTPRRWRKCASTFSYGGASFALPCTSRSSWLNETNSSTLAVLRPRSISRSLKTIVRFPFCSRKMNGSPAQNFVA